MSSSEKTAAFEKEAHLKELLESYGSVAVAFSGGVDSTYLLHVALEQLGAARVTVLTAMTSFLAEDENKDLVALAKEAGVRPIFLELDPLEEASIVTNPKDRCYHCKHLLFSAMKKAAKEAVLVEGSNASDADDFRPGMRAIRELGIKSPLSEVGLTKREIRFLSEQARLSTWNKPSLACLASRIPYGERLTEEKLAKTDAAEAWLHEKGFSQLRVRVHEASGGLLARIELLPGEMPSFFACADEAERAFSDLGFAYVTLDLAGYRMGSLNEGLTEEEKKVLMAGGKR